MQTSETLNIERTREKETPTPRRSGDPGEKAASGDERSILIVYATRYGHTGKIVEKIDSALRRLGHGTVIVRAGTDKPPDVDALTRDIKCVILGGPIYAGQFPRDLHEFIRDYRVVLNQLPSAFFSVSLTAAHEDKGRKNEIQNIVERFLAKHRWKPGRTASFAGALLYTRYGPFIRFIMKRISRSAGGGTDIHRDYVYTDWSEIPVFAGQIGAMLELAAKDKP